MSEPIQTFIAHPHESEAQTSQSALVGRRIRNEEGYSGTIKYAGPIDGQKGEHW